MDLDLFEKGVWPAVAFVLGFLTSRFTMTKAERREDQDRKFSRSKELLEEQETTFTDLADALKAYIDAETPDFDNFYRIATTGEKYLYRMKIVSDAILSDSVSSRIRDDTLVPKVVECATKTLPQIYESLRTIATKKGIKYSGELDRNKYQSIYSVAEKFGRLDSSARTGLPGQDP